MLRPTEPIAAGRAWAAVTELEQADPRLAATVDTVWDRIARADLTNEQGMALMDHLCCAVLAHYGYPLRGVDLNVIPANVRAAVRMARIPESHGCRYCGVVVEDHGDRVSAIVGTHQWRAPDEQQQDLRLRALILEEEARVLR